jgi:hypothetical protein
VLQQRPMRPMHMPASAGKADDNPGGDAAAAATATGAGPATAGSDPALTSPEQRRLAQW